MQSSAALDFPRNVFHHKYDFHLPMHLLSLCLSLSLLDLSQPSTCTIQIYIYISFSHRVLRLLNQFQWSLSLDLSPCMFAQTYTYKTVSISFAFLFVIYMKYTSNRIIQSKYYIQSNSFWSLWSQAALQGTEAWIEVNIGVGIEYYQSCRPNIETEAPLHNQYLLTTLKHNIIEEDNRFRSYWQSKGIIQQNIETREMANEIKAFLWSNQLQLQNK